MRARVLELDRDLGSIWLDRFGMLVDRFSIPSQAA